MRNVINVFSCDSKINKFKKKLGIFYFAFSWQKFQIGALISSLAVPEIEQYVWIGVLAKKKKNPKTVRETKATVTSQVERKVYSD